MDLELTCLVKKEFENLRIMIMKYTHFYKNKQDPWIREIEERLDNGKIKNCDKNDLKRIVQMADMWNFSGLEEPDDEIEKIVGKLKAFYFETYQERVFT